MAKNDIPPNSLTLRFKHGQTTVFVFAQELTPISKVKQELLEALHETHPDGLDPSPASHQTMKIPLPKSLKDVSLAVPKNVNDIDEGWIEIDTTSSSGADQTVKAFGLKEASMLAFLFAGEAKKHAFWVEFSNVDELYPDDDEEDEE